MLFFQQSKKLILSNKKLAFQRVNWLGRKDSNLRDGWTKTSCLTTWRRPIAITILQYQDLMSRIIFQYIKKECHLSLTFLI